jgi:hypothetical protein
MHVARAPAYCLNYRDTQFDAGRSSSQSDSLGAPFLALALVLSSDE